MEVASVLFRLGVSNQLLFCRAGKDLRGCLSPYQLAEYTAETQIILAVIIREIFGIEGRSWPIAGNLGIYLYMYIAIRLAFSRLSLLLLTFK